MKGKTLRKIKNKARLQAKLEFNNSNDFDLNFNQNSDVNDCLDLHGYTKSEAKSILVDFMSFALENNFSKIRIITGVGEDDYSVLKGVVKEYLSEMNYKFNQSSQNRGGNGAFDVWL